MTLETKEARELQHRFTRVQDIHIPDIMFQPIRFAEALPNVIFSELGGVIPSQVIFMTGPPGSGKSTVCSKLGAILKSKKSPVFLQLEMSEYQLKLQARKIDGFEKYYIVNSIESVEGILEDLIQFDPSIVILDSVQELAHKLFNGRDKDQIKIVDMFKDFAKKSFIPVILIGHCNKDGSYKGPSTVLHNVDTHIEIFQEKETGERMFRATKNRMGGDCTAVPFRIMSDRVVIGNFMYDPYEDGKEKIDKTNDEKLAIIKPKFEEAIKNMIDKTRSLSRSTFQLSKPVLEIGLEYLCVKYSDYMKTDTLTETDKVKLTWANTSTSWCKAGTSNINFSPKTFNRMRDRKDFGYSKEVAIALSHCKGRKEALVVWVLFHEFTHLFKEMQNHKQRFFDKLNEFAMNESWVFDLIENELLKTPETQLEKELIEI